MDEAVTRQIANFRTAIMGYHKTDVAELLADLESQRENAEARQEAADKTIASLRQELEKSAKDAEALTQENARLKTENEALQKRVSGYEQTNVTLEEFQVMTEENRRYEGQLEELDVLRKRVENLAQQNGKLKEDYVALRQKYEDTASLRQECDKLRVQLAEREEQSQAIQDALVSAQRMGKIVVSEAQQEADRLTTQAKQTATQTLEESRKRNAALQASYDRMLMDTSKMKTELIDLYRRHLALLSEIPGKGDVPALEEEILETL